MASLVDKKLFSGIYEGKKVFLTGHSGFKGSWLSLWLKEMGAIVSGYSLAPDTDPSHIEILNLDIDSKYEDIRNKESLKSAINNFQPDMIFHLAAQPLVLYSYEHPVETFETNVIGSLNLYETAKNCKSVRAILSVTTDKVYENYELERGYTEEDRFGGKDPYSASKGAMEILTNSYRHSFLMASNHSYARKLPLGVARAGNVIGGGDWAKDRLIPDIVKAASLGKATKIRNPYSTRPWQHVLEPLSGYLLLGQKILEGDMNFSDGFNFGPPESETYTVREVTDFTQKAWEKITYDIEEPKEKLHEANLLKLDCSKAREMLSWKPVWSGKKAIEVSIDWYRQYYEEKKVVSSDQLHQYIEDAAKASSVWTQDV